MWFWSILGCTCAGLWWLVFLFPTAVGLKHRRGRLCGMLGCSASLTPCEHVLLVAQGDSLRRALRSSYSAQLQAGASTTYVCRTQLILFCCIMQMYDTIKVANQLKYAGGGPVSCNAKSSLLSLNISIIIPYLLHQVRVVDCADTHSGFSFSGFFTGCVCPAVTYLLRADVMHLL